MTQVRHGISAYGSNSGAMPRNRGVCTGRRCPALLLCALLLPVLADAHKSHWIDSRGDAFQAEDPPKRVVSLAPSTTEIVFALGAGDSLVAVTRHCGLPADFASLPRLSGFDQPQPESLLMLEPDLVLASAITTPATVARLRHLGLNVAVLGREGIGGVEADIALAGSIFRRPDEADRILDDFQSARHHAALATRRLEGGQTPRVLVTYGPLQTFSAGPGSFMDALLQEAGVDNVARAAGMMWPTLSMEFILAGDPDYLIIIAPADQALTAAPAATLHALRQHRLWRQLSAVRQGRVYIMNENLANVPGPRLPQALKALLTVFYPQTQE